MDFTLGGSGHFSSFLPFLAPSGVAIGFDRDGDAIKRAEAVLPQWPKMRIELRQCRFSNAAEVLEEMGIAGIDLALFDLGVSAFQVGDSSRGFSFQADGPLLMQMGDGKKTAIEIVNSASERELTGILSDFGEERFARRIARSIVRKRGEKPIQSTLELVEAVDRAIPGPAKKNLNAIRARVFQSIRIVTNDEMDELQDGLMSAIRYLLVGGRMGVISWHSLEDRTVKRTFKFHSPKGESEEEWVLLPATAKPVTPSAGEVAANPRSRSAKLRVVTKAPREDVENGR